MKRILFFLLTALSCVNTVNAALPIKQPAVCYDTLTNVIQVNTTYSFEQINSSTVNSENDVLQLGDRNKKKHHHSRNNYDDRPGWPGIVALSCAVLSIFGGFIPGIIVGIIGLDQQYKNRGLALAGLILSIVSILTIIIVTFIALGVFS